MSYFKINAMGGGSVPECPEPEPVDYTELIQSIRDKGGTVADDATLEEIILALSTIPGGGSSGGGRKYPVNESVTDDQYNEILLFVEEKAPEFPHFWELIYTDRQDKEVLHYVVTQKDVGGYVIGELFGSIVIQFANGVSDYYYTRMIIDGVLQEPDSMEGEFADTFNHSIKENTELEFKYLEASAAEGVDYTELIQAIRDKGGTVADNATLSEIIAAVGSIPAGGGSLPGVPIGPTISETIVFSDFLMTENVNTEIVEGDI